MKICNTCQIKKELTEFLLKTYVSKKFGERTTTTNKCKKCTTARQIERRKENPELAKKVNQRAKEQYQKNKELHKRRSKEWHKNHPEKRRGYVKKHMSKPENKIKRNIRQSKRMANDQNFKIRSTAAQRIRQAIKRQNGKKSSKTMKLIGCTIQFLISYLESKWLPGMSWSNYGNNSLDWHIDHIIPCASFDLTNPEEQKICFHYSNMQPLWKTDNETKNDLLPNGERARHSDKRGLILFHISILYFHKLFVN